MQWLNHIFKFNNTKTKSNEDFVILYRIFPKKKENFMCLLSISKQKKNENDFIILFDYQKSTQKQYKIIIILIWFASAFYYDDISVLI